MTSLSWLEARANNTCGLLHLDIMSEFQHYEPRFWGLDPVFSTRVKLNIVDVLSLQPHPAIPGTKG